MRAPRTLVGVGLLLILLVLVLIVFVVVTFAGRSTRNRQAEQLADAKADARRLIERLGGQVYNLTGSNDASKQALADAGERLNAAGSQIEQATTVPQTRLAKETALEGLYYVRAAREAMGLDPGPAVPELDGQSRAGRVTEDRTIDYDGRRIEASPNPTAQTPNYYPGGYVAGRPVPAGWYSEPWWKTALVAGAWGVGSALLFDALFSGMSGVAYGASGFEGGYGSGYDAGYQAGFDAGDQAGYDAGGYDGGGYDNGGWGGDYGGGSGFGDFGGDSGGGFGDFGGGDFGGGDFGGGGDF
ncbi:GA module-containing protein [Nocardia terpenica]|nr:GA module-containing protein [Nocardia terpenica]